MDDKKFSTGFVNNIFLKDKDGKDKVVDGHPVVIKQGITVESDAKHYLELSGAFALPPVTEADGTTAIPVETRPVLSIDKIESTDDKEHFSINLENCAFFKTKDDQTLAQLLGTENSAVLNVTAPPSFITISKKNQEICFKIVAESGKTFVITSNATKIKVECEGQTFTYQTLPETSIDINMSPKFIEEFYDKDKHFCKCFDQSTFNAQKKAKDAAPEDESVPTPDGLVDMPKKINGFPVNLIASMAITHPELAGKGNAHLALGESGDKDGYSITTIDPSGKLDTPYVFTTKTKGSKKENYFLLNGKMVKCDKFYLQYEAVDGKNVPRIVIETKQIYSTKKDGSELVHYAIDLEVDDKGALTRESTDAINMLGNISKLTLADEASTENVEFSSADATAIRFEKKDKREYSTDYDFIIKPDSYTLTSDDNLEDETGDSDISSNAVDEETEQDEVASEEEKEEKKEKKEEDEEIITKGSEKVLEKQTEAWMAVVETLGFFLAIGAAVTGLGGLMIAAFALLGVGLTGQTLASEMRFKPFQFAAKKVKEYEDEDKEAADFEAKFLENEQTLDNYEQLSHNKENELADLFAQEDGIMHNFQQEFDDFGIGFENLPEGTTKSQAFLSRQGYEAKAQMTSTLQQISQTTDLARRNMLINQFMNENFSPDMPKEQQDALKESMFGASDASESEIVKKNEELKPVVALLSEVVAYEKQETELYDSQSDRLESATDRMVERVIGSKKVTANKRKNLAERYGGVIIRRFAADSSLSENRIDKLISIIPEEQQLDIVNILDSISKEIETDVDFVKEIAKINKAKIDVANEAGVYGAVMNNIAAKGEKVYSRNQVKEGLVDVMELETGRTCTAVSLTSDTAKQISDLRDACVASGTATADELNLVDTLRGIVEFGISADGVATAFSELKNEVLANADNLADLSSEDVGSIMPEFGNPKDKTPFSYLDVASTLSMGTDENAQKLRGKVEHYNESVTNYRQSYGAVEFADKLSNIETLVKNILTAHLPEVKDEEIEAKGDLILQDLLENPEFIFARANIPSPAIDSAANILAMTGIALESLSLSNEERQILTQVNAVLSGVTRGTFLQSNINGAKLSGLKPELINAGKSVKECKAELAQKIGGYKFALKQIRKLKKNEHIMQKFKNSTAGNASDDLMAIIQEELGDTKINDLTFSQVLGTPVNVRTVVQRCKAMNLNDKDIFAVASQIAATDFDNMSYKDRAKTVGKIFKKNLKLKTYNDHKEEIRSVVKLAGSPFDLDKAAQTINAQIKDINNQCERIVHTTCDKAMGKKYSESEYKHCKKALAGDNKAKKMYSTSIELIESLAKNSPVVLAEYRLELMNEIYEQLINEGASEEDAQSQAYSRASHIVNNMDKETDEDYADFVKQKIKAEVEKDPKITPKKLAKNLKIDVKEYQKQKKNVRDGGLLTKTQVALWLKEKEARENAEIAEELKTAWEEAKAGNYAPLKHFCDSARTQEDELGSLKGKERQKKKTEIANRHKGETKKQKKQRLSQNKKYSHILNTAGLNIAELDGILGGKADAIPSKLSVLENRSPIERLDKAIEREKQEIRRLKTQSEKLTKEDYKLCKACDELEDFKKDYKEYRAKIEFIEQLEKQNVPKEIIDKAFIAFVEGDKDFFDKTQIEGKSLNEMLEDFDFSIEDSSLIKRLGINPKDLKDSKNRKQRLKNIILNLNAEHLNKQTQLEDAQKAAKNVKVEKTDITKVESDKAKEGLGLFAKIFAKIKQKAETKAEKIAEEKAEKANKATEKDSAADEAEEEKEEKEETEEKDEKDKDEKDDSEDEKE